MLVAWIAAGGGLGIAVLLVRAVSGPVSRNRVQRFAARQELVITPGNGNLVINYLRTTRRWRVIGLSSGVLVTAAWSLRDSRLTVNALAAFAGWFVGALVAEYRVVSLEPGSRRAASLVPRLLRRQLRAQARTLLVGMVVVVAAFGLASILAAALRDRRRPDPDPQRGAAGGGTDQRLAGRHPITPAADGCCRHPIRGRRSTMIVDVDLSSPVPPFEQVRQQISALAAAGVLPAGTRLPAIRQLAADLGLAPGTVARAYRELEAEKVVVSRVRHGTTVLARPEPTEAERAARLDDAARVYALTAHALGADHVRALRVVRAALAARPLSPSEAPKPGSTSTANRP